MDPDRLDDLVARHFAGNLTAEETEKLNALLKNEPVARAELIRAARQELDLSEALGRELPEPPQEPSSHSLRWRPYALLTAAAALVAVAIWAFSGPPATLMGSKGDVFALDGVTLTLGADSEIAQTLLRDGRRELSLRRGEMLVDVTASSPGVLVTTPEGTLEDIGTTFRVLRESESAPTVLTVEHGLVRFTPARRPTAWQLDSGAGRVPLSPDGKLGAVRERRGTLQVRPRGSLRYSLANERFDLEPGDLVRTGTRGAHGGKLLLVNGTEITIGPGALFELVDLTTLRLLEGDVAVKPGKDVTVRYTGPESAEGSVADGEMVLSVIPEGVERLADEPDWLASYRKDETPSLGALLAQVDGRDVKLEMGYHKVVVDIRDQIARTVIEESFENNTDEVLEGVFYFPLPAKASISGFAMWIDDELVEGEIVEKQRARQIFEQLLREKKDPGLLEWTGGNVFKARVYPIPKRGEKRIKITYTEVLTGDGSSYRYHYPLVSDLTRLTPLSKLEILVRIASARPLTEARCETHDCRIQKSTSEARIEFSRRDYIPTRDFELRIATAPDEDGVTAVAHRRDDDGYLMLMMDGPERANEGRDVLPDAGAQDVILLLDTSHSVRGTARDQQVAFAEAFLASLGKDDTVQVATLDTEVRWFGAGRAKPTPEWVGDALGFHEQRFPLGWSDLEGAMTQALSRARKGTHVIYVGDGMHTATHVAASEVVRRLGQQHDDGVRVHAVAVGNEQETLLLDGLAALGSGTRHAIADDADPATIAGNVLGAMVLPGLQNVEVTFGGGQVAAIHPERIPSLGTGEQAFVLARFDPVLGAPTKATLTGTLDGEPVRREVSLSLDGNAEGNSFLPRLWARKRLDHLLEQGSDASVRERIISLSERFQIITPYTSFLVLEDEEDRRRFKLQKRLKMRDGERFFVRGRQQVDLELARQQMQLARQWRLEQRRSLLRSLETLGRRPLQVATVMDGLTRSTATIQHLGIGGGGGGGERGRARGGLRIMEDLGRAPRLAMDRESARLGDWDIEPPAEAAAPPGAPSPSGGFSGDDDFSPARNKDAFFGPTEKRLASRMVAESSNRRRSRGRFGYGSPGQQRRPAANGMFDRLFLPPSPAPSHSLRSHFAAPLPAQQWFRESPWPADARDLARSLDRRETVASLAGGVRVRVTSRSPEVPAHVLEDLLLGPNAWVTIHHDGASRAAANTLEAVHEGRRLRVALPWMLGGTRGVRGGDVRDHRSSVPELFVDHSKILADWAPAVRDLGNGRKRLVVTRGLDRHEFEIDTVRSVLLVHRHEDRGRLVYRTVHEDFVAVGDEFFPGKITSYGADGRVTNVWSLEVTALDAEAFASAVAERLKLVDDATMLDADVETDLVDARSRLVAGDATVDDVVALFDHYAGSQRFDELPPLVAALEKLVADAPGKPRLMITAAMASNDGALALERVRAALRALPEDESAALLRAFDLMEEPQKVSAPERLELLTMARPTAYEGAIATSADRLRWARRFEQVLRDCGREAAALEFAASTKDVEGGDGIDFVLFRAQSLTRSRRTEEALAVYEAAATRFEGFARSRVYAGWSSLLESHWRIPEASRVVARWMTELPAFADRGTWRRHLSLLIKSGRLDEAERLMTAWLDAPPEDDAPQWEYQRLQGAIDHLTVSSINLQGRRFDPAWGPRLIAFARAAASRPELWSHRRAILTSGNVKVTKEAKALRDELLVELEKNVADWTLPRVHEVTSLLRAMKANGDRINKIPTAVLERFLGSDRADPARLFNDYVMAFGSAEEKVTFLNARLGATADAWMANRLRHRLVDVLLAGEWKPEHEKLVAAALPVLRDERASGVALEPRTALTIRLQKLMKAFDWMRDGRVQAALATVNQDPTTSPRVRKTKTAEARVAAAKELLGVVRDVRNGTRDEPMVAAWLRQEVLYWRAKSGEKAADLAPLAVEELKALLDGFYPKRPEDRGLVLARAFEAALGLVVDETVAESERDELVAAIEGAIQDAGETVDARRDARGLLRATLLALGRTEALRDALSGWFDGGETVIGAAWGPELSKVLTDGDALEDAVSVLEKTRERRPLAADDLDRLATLRLALNRKDAALEARKDAYAAQSAWTLYSSLNSELSRYRRTGNDVPEELPASVPVRLEVLLRKGDSWRGPRMVQRYYQLTRDFRILRALVASQRGMTERTAYSLLPRLGDTLALIQEEATVDEIRRAVEEERKDATESEARRLSLLHALVRARAADQLQGSGDHEEATLAALDHWHHDDLAEGEASLRAKGLDAFASVANDTIRERVLDLYAKLQAACRDQEDEHLSVAASRGAMLRSWKRVDEGIRVLAAALDRRRAAGGGKLPPSAFSRVDNLVKWLREASRHREGETLLVRALARDHAASAKQTLARSLRNHRIASLKDGATLAVGKDAELYGFLRESLEEDLAATRDADQATSLVSLRSDLARTAHKRGLDDVGEDFVAFGYDQLPRVLGRVHYRNGQNMVRTVAGAMKSVNGPLESLRFLVTRGESEPAWLPWMGQDFWSSHGWTVTRTLRDVRQRGSLLAQDPSLDRRLLARVLVELQEWLTGTRWRSNDIFDDDDRDFWREKRDAFRTTAVALGLRVGDDERLVMKIAGYLANDLSAHDDAIALALALNRRKTMGRGNRYTLARWLQHEKRHAEAVPLLAALTEAAPLNGEYARSLVVSLHAVGKTEEALTALTASYERLKEAEKLDSDQLGRHAGVAVQIGRDEEAVGWFRDAITARVRERRNRGRNDRTLSSWHQQLAQALLRLDRHDEAVDAASGAIVVWDPRRSERKKAVENLEEVLAKHDDLTSFIATLDERTAETGQDTPILRRSLARVLLKKNPAVAATQARLALEAGPPDAAAHRLLVDALRNAGRLEEAVVALRTAVDAQGRTDMDLVEDLAKLLARLERPTQAERAWTTLVELKPAEVDGYTRLAEHREKEKRWNAAEPLWTAVADIRNDDPTGLIGRLRALINLDRKDDARTVAEQIEKGTWDKRFAKLLREANRLTRGL